MSIWKKLFGGNKSKETDSVFISLMLRQWELPKLMTSAFPNADASQNGGNPPRLNASAMFRGWVISAL